MNNKSKILIPIAILVAVLLLVLGVIIFLVLSGKGSFLQTIGISPNFGSKSGTYIILEITGGDPSPDNVVATVERMNEKLSTYSANAKVVQSGLSQFRIEIPDVDPQNAEPILNDLLTNEQFQVRDDEGRVWLTGIDIESVEAQELYVDYLGGSIPAVEINLTQNGRARCSLAYKENVGESLTYYYGSRVLWEEPVEGDIGPSALSFSGFSNMGDAENIADKIRKSPMYLDLTLAESNVPTPGSTVVPTTGENEE